MLSLHKRNKQKHNLFNKTFEVKIITEKKIFWSAVTTHGGLNENLDGLAKEEPP